ncbi:MAG: leucine-rich repeat domain-containing protein, partial [Prevotellaceae bacterium]|nr:leucine-rich repeat domain-containing protein [Prevotellaceae bacterium]
MRKNTRIFCRIFCALCLITSNLTAQTTVGVANGGGLEAAVKAQQPNVSLVTNLAVTGTIDARDFRFIRDSLNSTLVSLDLSGVSIVAYSGTLGTAYTTEGNDQNATYGANAVPLGAFYHRKQTGSSFFPTITEKKMTVLQTLTLPNAITAIGNDAFNGSAVTSLDLSATAVQTIGNNVFSKCAALQTILLPNTLQTIGDTPFPYCTSLQSVTIPSSVTSLGTQIGFFEGCIN